MEVLPSSHGLAAPDSVKDPSVQDAWTSFLTLTKEGIKVSKKWTCLEAQADTVLPQPLFYGGRKKKKKKLLEFTKYNYWLISSSVRPVRNQWCPSWEISGVTSHVLRVPNGMKHSESTAPWYKLQLPRDALCVHFVICNDTLKGQWSCKGNAACLKELIFLSTNKRNKVFQKSS